MHSRVSLTIPQPCHQSWAAMIPVAAGRHCAACAKTVVDFTLKTDAEILAFLVGAAHGSTCGRFAAGQLERPLQRAAPAALATRWRAWLAAVVAVWAVREGIGTEAKAQAATEWRARYWGGPVPAAPPVETAEASSTVLAPLPVRQPLAFIVLPSVAKGPSMTMTMGMVSSQSHRPVAFPLAAAPLVLRGRITDAADGQGLPGVTVLLKGTTTGVSTGVGGSYELPVPVALANIPALIISVSSVGYVTQERTLATRTADAAQAFQLKADVMGMMGAVVVCQLSPRRLPPAPWHPRAFYYWGRYWLTRPFRRN